MELWQMDVMGGIWLTDGRELKAVTGIDDHSRFCVAAGLIERASASAVCRVFRGQGSQVSGRRALDDLQAWVLRCERPISCSFSLCRRSTCVSAHGEYCAIIAEPDEYPGRGSSGDPCEGRGRRQRGCAAGSRLCIQ
jgi:hypothetical protein